MTVLIADDSALDRRAARVAVEAAGHRVVEAVDGATAIDAFEREKPDLVLLDVVMPGLGGLETCRILRARSRGRYTPIMMLSSRSSVSARVEGLRTGADDYLCKPFEVDELQARIEVLQRRIEVSSTPEASPAAVEEDQIVSWAGGRLRIAARLRDRFLQEIERAERLSDPLACVYVQLSEATESVLAAEFAEGGVLNAVLQGALRRIDLSARCGNDGWLMLLPNTHFTGALSVAERVCQGWMLAGRAENLSVGVSFFPSRDRVRADQLVELAVDAAGMARDAGKNRVCLVQHQGYIYSPEPGL